MEQDDRLSPEKHEENWHLIVEAAFSSTRPSEKPTVIILAGQPGAGKSGMRTQALEELGGADQTVVVDVDDLREFHTGYPDFQRENGRTAASRVQADASAWADRLIEESARGRRNVIIDGTLKTERNALALCDRFSAEGYRVDVRALAAAKEDSELRVHARYEKARAAGHGGRWVPKPIREQSLDGMVASVEAIERSRAADEVSTYRMDADDQPQRFYSNPHCRTEGGTGAADAVRRERNRPRTRAELRERADFALEIEDMTRRRDPGLTEPESREAVDLAEAACRASPVHRKNLKQFAGQDEKTK